MIKNEILEKLMPITEEERTILDGKGVNTSIYTSNGDNVIRYKKLERLNIEPCACFNSFISSVRLSPALAPSSCPLEQSLWDPSRLCRPSDLECLSGSPSPQLSLVSPEELTGLCPLTLVLR